MSVSIETLALAKKFAKGYTDDAITQLPKGLVYRGAVASYANLPNNAEVGDTYTTLDTTQEYVWGPIDSVNQWIQLGAEVEANVQTQGTEDRLTSVSINGTTYIIPQTTHNVFPSNWNTSGTITQFCNSVNQDSSAIMGMSYLGELTCSDLPFNGNADAVVEIIDGITSSNKVIHIIITSGNVYPYRWEYTYWNGGSNISGWVGFQPYDPLTNNEIDIIWSGGYSITANITNGTVVGVDKILFNPIQITISPDSGYDVPETITVVGAHSSYDEYTGVITLSNPTGNVTITATCPSALPEHVSLNNMSWSDIKKVADFSAGPSYFSVGDAKQITLNGTVGTLALDNLSTCVYILGFDHNSAVEGTGISFGGFKTAVDDGKYVALCDGHNNQGSTDGFKWFNMNHNTTSNVGGWQGCDMRYDILGSVEAKGQQNATSVAVSSPVENTLIAALPSDLRGVLKPITKWTDNVGGGTDTAANVTTTVDYMPLLAEYEIFGERKYANSTEQSHQTQYIFFANGGSKARYNHSTTSSPTFWWSRSPSYRGNSYFCRTTQYSQMDFSSLIYSHGVAPVFLV